MGQSGHWACPYCGRWNDGARQYCYWCRTVGANAPSVSRCPSTSGNHPGTGVRCIKCAGHDGPNTDGAPVFAAYWLNRETPSRGQNV
jgi:hypothetical protein